MENVHPIFQAALSAVAPAPRQLPAYCDYIADCIKQGLDERIQNGFADLLRHVGPVKMDLHPTEGWFVSTKKTIEITDQHGKLYRVTVEEIDP